MLRYRTAAVAVVALLAALAVPAHASEDVIPTHVTSIRFGTPGVPTMSPYSTETGFSEWQDVGTVDIPDDLELVFTVRSDYWLQVGVMNVEICLETPSGVCLTSEGENLRVGTPCVRVDLVCPSFAEGSNIEPNEPGVWKLKFRGTTTAEHVIRVYAWTPPPQ